MHRLHGYVASQLLAQLLATGKPYPFAHARFNFYSGLSPERLEDPLSLLVGHALASVHDLDIDDCFVVLVDLDIRRNSDLSNALVLG